MRRVALTGNIAAGKSAVAERLRARGARVIDADDLARQVVEPGSNGLRAIVERWGPGVLLPDGRLNRPTLRRIVFADADERAALERITHPEIDRLRAAQVEDAESSGATLVICDIPLLFEKGLQDQFDAVILVDAPELKRFERLTEIRGLAADEARAMIEAQMPSGLKRQRADYIIDNDGSLSRLDTRVEAVWQQLQSSAPQNLGVTRQGRVAAPMSDS